MTVRYRPHPELRLSSLEGEGVVLHLGSRRYFTVSKTGLVILEALSTPRTLDELVTVIVERYEVGRDHATASVLGFLERCREADLITELEGEG
jgi:coenzyme PQQ synthesis protein D (PqqD)